MPTDIYFTVMKGENVLSVRVQEEPEQVHEAIQAAGGDQPVLLTRRRGERPVYVNPRNIAYWQYHSGEPPRIQSF